LIARTRRQIAALATALAGCAHASGVRPEPALWTPESRTPSALTQEVTSFLGLRETCARSWQRCAEAIEQAPGPLQPATRVVTAAEAWFYAGAQSPEKDADAYLRCAAASHRYLFEPELPGRSPALLAPAQRAFRLYNACSERWLAAAASGADGSLSPARLETVALVDWRVRAGAFPIAAVRSLELASGLSTEGLRSDQRQDGLGVALVARTQPPASDTMLRLIPRVLPVTALLRFAGSDAPSIELYDAFDGAMVETAFGPLPLAVDFSVAFNLWARKLPGTWEALYALTRPPATLEPEIDLLQPYDPKRLPVILIHGLGSGPRTWIDLANDLLGDPRIGPRIQIWTCRYVSSLPLLVNRLALATALEAAQRTLDPAGADPASHEVVLIGHSMGGVLARLLVSSSGTRLWDAAFTRPPSELEATPEDRASAEALFLFAPWPPAKRALFIAAPHRGSPHATGWSARVARSLIAAPPATLGVLKRLAQLDPTQIRESLREAYLGGGPKSIDTLSASQPVSAANASLPIAPGVVVHSIVGVEDPDAAEPGDGYVPLASTLWPGESSRLVIASGHDVHRQPAAILEIKRILLEQLGISARDAASARP